MEWAAWTAKGGTTPTRSNPSAVSLLKPARGSAVLHTRALKQAPVKVPGMRSSNRCVCKKVLSRDAASPGHRGRFGASANESRLNPGALDFFEHLFIQLLITHIHSQHKTEEISNPLPLPISPCRPAKARMVHVLVTGGVGEIVCYANTQGATRAASRSACVQCRAPARADAALLPPPHPLSTRPANPTPRLHRQPHGPQLAQQRPHRGDRGRPLQLVPARL